MWILMFISQDVLHLFRIIISKFFETLSVNKLAATELWMNIHHGQDLLQSGYLPFLVWT